MQIIALERELQRLPKAAGESILREEARALWALQQEGLVRSAFFRSDRKEAVLIIEAPSAAECEARLGRLPLVQGEYITFELIPLVPYNGFARLFEP